MHNFPTESNGLFTMVGKTCATENASLSSGMSKEAVRVESIVSPFGNITLNGLTYLVVLQQGSLINKKCPVKLESTMTVS
jgi:hypothetical protein